jgi:hypothetical protein
MELKYSLNSLINIYTSMVWNIATSQQLQNGFADKLNNCKADTICRRYFINTFFSEGKYLYYRHRWQEQQEFVIYLQF